LTPSEANALLEKASVPEHSVDFMQAMSGGEAFLEGPYLFFGVGESLLCIGYPLEGEYDPARFDQAILSALNKTGAVRCWAICPRLPERLAPHCRAQDVYFVRAADARVPGRLERVAERAAACLRVDQGERFTAGHRRLWDEFTSRTPLPEAVRNLFEGTERVIGRAAGLVLLNAWDPKGRLAACMLLDTAPRHFTSYLIGARARAAAVPYASDLLMRELIRLAAGSGKEFLHLGLGVNDGIRRYKTKWGARASLAYELAAWKPSAGRLRPSALLQVLAAMPSDSMADRAAQAALPRQRRFAMLWELEKNGRRSWIGGTAHFFCYSFEIFLQNLFEKVDTVMFEGPLDPASIALVSATGRSPLPGSARLIDAVTEDEILRLERVVCGPRGFWARLLGLQAADPPDVRFLLAHTRPWMAFFSLWAAFLARHGWNQSVDLEAWNLAHSMEKSVLTMETIPEQIETLESIPIPRIVNFFRSCERWPRKIQCNRRAYLRGDLEGMAGTTTEFPTRIERVIGRRDADFLTRMLPHIERGRTAVFVGTAHMLNLRGMLAEAGFSVRRGR
jgi:uncharacterized protein YbaP (TraB family)